MSSLVWISVAGIIGFSISEFFSRIVMLSRRVFLIPYITLTGLFLFAYFHYNRVSVDFWTQNLLYGVVLAVAVSVFIVRSVFSQPFSRNISGAAFVFDLMWAGAAYGIIDGLLLNVMPVLAVWTAFSSNNWDNSLSNNILIGSLALLASLFITLVYHLGYTEFRNRRNAILVLVGNGLITLTFIISLNPLAAVITHVVMHVGAVVRGPETTLQLPPHYWNNID